VLLALRLVCESQGLENQDFCRLLTAWQEVRRPLTKTVSCPPSPGSRDEVTHLLGISGPARVAVLAGFVLSFGQYWGIP
jgi:hypothetical protein